MIILTNKISAWPNVPSIPIPGVFGRPVCKTFMMFRRQHQVPDCGTDTYSYLLSFIHLNAVFHYQTPASSTKYHMLPEPVSFQMQVPAKKPSRCLDVPD